MGGKDVVKPAGQEPTLKNLLVLYSNPLKNIARFGDIK